MYNFPIGVLLESFNTDSATALRLAKEAGASAVQVYCVRGELDARTMTSEARKNFKKMVADNGLTISAVCGDFVSGDKNVTFSNPEQSGMVIERSKQVLELAADLGTNIVTTHVGVVPSDHSCDKFKIVQQNCRALAEYADSMNAHFAIETGPEIATTLRAFLDTLESKGVGVNLDPANLVMVTGDDPVKAVHTLKDYIVHTHAKDGRRLLVGDPLVIYGEIEEEIQHSLYFEELPLGEGDVDFPNYLRALDEIGYKGYLTIERETGADPKADIFMAANFLKDIIKKG